MSVSEALDIEDHDHPPPERQRHVAHLIQGGVWSGVTNV